MSQARSLLDIQKKKKKEKKTNKQKTKKTKKTKIKIYKKSHTR